MRTIARDTLDNELWFKASDDEPPRTGEWRSGRVINNDEYVRIDDPEMFAEAFRKSMDAEPANARKLPEYREYARREYRGQAIG